MSTSTDNPNHYKLGNAWCYRLITDGVGIITPLLNNRVEFNRKIDSKRRFSLPVDVRRRYCIETDDLVIIEYLRLTGDRHRGAIDLARSPITGLEDMLDTQATFTREEVINLLKQAVAKIDMTDSRFGWDKTDQQGRITVPGSISDYYQRHRKSPLVYVEGRVRLSRK